MINKSSHLIMCILFFIVIADHAFSTVRAEDVDPALFGAKGDGITDDSVALQSALTLCSKNGLTCKIANGKNYLVKLPLFLWGNAKLIGEGEFSSIVFDAPQTKYLFNIGISGQNILEEPFNGIISSLKFRIKSGNYGRIIFLWRTNGATIANNIFDVGSFAYSATSSGNDQAWVANGFTNCTRKNIVISSNLIKATATNIGSEGIGLGNFDGALIENNSIVGVGDDPIGIHFCENVKILNNDLKSVDGRIYVSNSKNIEIAYNKHERVPSVKDGKFYTGIALVYIGFETLQDNAFAAPTNINVHHNVLSYPKGSVDLGGAIYVYGPRNVLVEFNRVINNSSVVKATGFRMLPANFEGVWQDPDNIDPTYVARVWNIDILSNSMEGDFPLPIIMTGNCTDYKGEINVKDNTASYYKLYCSNVKTTGNKTNVPYVKIINIYK